MHTNTDMIGSQPLISLLENGLVERSTGYDLRVNIFSLARHDAQINSCLQIEAGAFYPSDCYK